MPTPLTNNFALNAPKPLDDRYCKFVSGASVPYASVSEVNTMLNSSRRHVGLTVLIAGSPNVEYWYLGGIADGNLVLKTVQGGDTPSIETFTNLSGTSWNLATDGRHKTKTINADTTLTVTATDGDEGFILVTGGGNDVIIGSYAITTVVDGDTFISVLNAAGKLLVFKKDFETAPVVITPPAPTNGIVDDTANTFAYTLSSGYLLSDHEQTLNGGTAWSAATNPVSVGNVSKAIGQVGVRVKAATGRNASAGLFNQTAFTAATSGPELQYAVVEDAQKDVVVLTYDQPLDDSSLPVASDFTLNGAAGFVKGEIPAPEITPTSVSLHANAPSGGSGLSRPKFPSLGSPTFGGNINGAQDFTFVNVNAQSKIRQGGTLRSIKFYLDSIPSQLTAFRFQIRRSEAGFLARKYEKDIFSSLVVGLNEIQLDNPITIESGDVISVWLTTNAGIGGNWLTLHEALSNPADGMYYYPQAGGQAIYLESLFIQTPGYFPIEVFVEEGADVVFFGDSRIEGYSFNSALSYNYAASGETGTMSYKFEKLYGMRSVNMGRSGNTSNDMIARFAADVLGHHPTYAILGGTQNGTDVSIYGNMVDQCIAAGIQPIILAIMPYEAYTSATTTTNNALQAMAATKGAWFLNVNQLIGSPESGYQQLAGAYAFDGGHQNSEGNDLIAAAIAELFRTHMPVAVQDDTVSLKLSSIVSYSDDLTIDVVGTRIKNMSGASAANETAAPVTNNVVQAPEAIILNKEVAANGGFLETSPGIWGGTWGLATKRLAAGASGRIWIRHNTSQSWLAFSSDKDAYKNANPGNNYFDVTRWGFQASGTNLFPIYGQQNQWGITTAPGDYWSLYRDGGTGEVKLQASADGVTWNNIYTSPDTFTGALYIHSRSGACQPMLFGDFETF